MTLIGLMIFSLYHGPLIIVYLGEEGVGIGKLMMYVCDINIDNNTVTLCKNEELFSNKLTARNINLISVEKIEEPIE